MVSGYRILYEAGRGGMAVVYRARQENLGRDVALKMLSSTLAFDPGFLARFHQEAHSVASLQHPAILVIHDVGAFQEQPYLVTEFIEGGTLVKYLGTPQPLGTVVQLLGPIASALDHAHARGILHRDVKPANILLRQDGGPVLADFGLAVAAEANRRLTRTGLTMGTPEYMAPEQATQPSSSLTPAVDRYSLAVIAYELLTGRVPFEGPTPVAVVMAQVTQAPPPPRALNPALALGLDAVLLSGLAKEPDHRYPSATAYIQALVATANADAPEAMNAALPPTVAVAANAIPRAAGAMAGPPAPAGAAIVSALRAPGSGPADPILINWQPTQVAGRLPRRHRRVYALMAAIFVATLAVAVAGVFAWHGGIRLAGNTPASVTRSARPPTSTGQTTRIAIVVPAGSGTASPGPTDVPTASARPLPSTTLLAQPLWVAALSPGEITTVAGNSRTRIDSNGVDVGTYTGNGGLAKDAGFSRPFSVAVDALGNLIVADTFNNRIRKIALDSGIVTNIADNGDYHFSGDGGLAIDAGISPNDVALDQLGNLYIADAANHRVRKVSASTGIVTTVAGTGTYGDSGDGGLATQAEISFPNYVAFDNEGNIYFVDFGAERVRKIDVNTGYISTVAGDGVVRKDTYGIWIGSYSGDGGPA